MRAFSTRAHAFMDYFLAALLIAMPWLARFVDSDPATWIPVAAGALLLLYSLATDYELGAVRRLQMPVHLWLDAVLGILLAISPWVFEFDQRVWVPHLGVGLVLVGVAFISDTIPGYERRGAARAGPG